MNPRKILATALLAATAVACGGAGPMDEAAPDALSDDVIAGMVRTALDDSRAAIDAGDLDAAGSFYADDPRFLWVEDGVVTYETAAEAARSLQQIGQYGQVEVDFSPARVDVLGPDTATLFTTHTTTVGSGEGSFSFSGALTITMIRTEEGWRFLSGSGLTLNRRS